MSTDTLKQTRSVPIAEWIALRNLSNEVLRYWGRPDAWDDLERAVLALIVHIF